MGSLASTAERMPRCSRDRVLCVRAIVELSSPCKLARGTAQQSGSGERGKVSAPSAGLESAPAACGSGLTAIAVTAAAQQHHELQRRHAAFDDGNRGGDECARGGRGAGRCIGHGATSAEGSRVQMLQPIGRRRTSGSTHFDAARQRRGRSGPFFRSAAARSTAEGSAGLAERRPTISATAPSIGYNSNRITFRSRIT